MQETTLYTLPYFGEVKEIEHPTVTRILYEFIKHANGKRGYLDIIPYTSDNTEIPLRLNPNEVTLTYGKRLSWHLGEQETQPYSETNAKEWGAWLVDFLDNTLICEEHATVTLMTFYSRNIPDATPETHMEWTVRNGKIINTKPA